MFLLFSGMDHYPCGGIEDLIGSFDMHNKAFQKMSDLNIFDDWAHIFNTETGEIWFYRREGEKQEFEEYEYKAGK